MLAISAHETEKHHPNSTAQAYQDIGILLAQYGFEKMQKNLYTNNNKNMTNLFNVINALKKLHCFPTAVGNIHAFRITQWSDFTATIKL